MRHPDGVLTLLLGIVLFVTRSEAFLGPAALSSCSRYAMMFFVFNQNKLLVTLLLVACSRIDFPFLEAVSYERGRSRCIWAHSSASTCHGLLVAISIAAHAGCAFVRETMWS